MSVDSVFDSFLATETTEASPAIEKSFPHNKVS
jgi:hypothetical protein